MKDGEKDTLVELVDLEGRSHFQLGDYVKNTQSMKELTTYNTLFGGSLVDLILRDPDAQ